MVSPPALFYIPHETFLSDARALAQQIGADGWRPDFVVAIGRGGLVPGVYVSHQLDVPLLSIDLSAKVPAFAGDLFARVAEKSVAGERLVFVDDINDSGGTIAGIRQALDEAGCDAGNIRFGVLIDNIRSNAAVDYRARNIDRQDDKRWFVFPWEAVGETATIVQEALSLPDRLA